MRLPALSVLRYHSQAIAAHFDKAAALQMKASTGKKLLLSSDDPALAANIKSVQNYLEQLNHFQINISLAESRIAQKNALSEESMGLMIKAKELLIKAQNDTLDDNARTAIAIELQGVLDRQFDLANARDQNGQYLYGGFNTTTAPFQKVNSVISYKGTQDTVQLPIGLNCKIDYVESGSKLFTQMPSGENMFNALSTLIKTLQTPIHSDEDRLQVHASMDQLSGSLDNIVKDISTHQTVIGNQGMLVETQKTLFENLLVDQKTLLDHLSEADMPEVLSDLTRQMTLLELTQGTYMKLQELSLSVLFRK